MATIRDHVRQAGVLLHISSLPSPWGVGDLGPGASRMADAMARSGISVWQVLPLQETSSTFGHSPYSPVSAFAGNRAFISPELLCQEGFISADEIPPEIPNERSSTDQAMAVRLPLIERSWQRRKDDQDFKRFKEENLSWLRDYCLFSVLKKRFSQRTWTTWPTEFRDRDERVLSQVERQDSQELDLLAFGQYLFFRQQIKLKHECNDLGLEIVGDMPIYVVHDGPDVWANRDLFQLDQEGLPSSVAGVPPDYYSEDGQLWGNPLYLWENHLRTGFEWWMDRLRHGLKLYDRVRIDHFRGMVGYWSIPSGEKTAKNGRWERVPYPELMSRMREEFPDLPFLAEDLGVITEEVKEAIEELGLPGMAVLQFAFDGDTGKNPYAPHNHEKTSVVYTGTHDNDTSMGWFQGSSHSTRRTLEDYTGRSLDGPSAVDALIRMALGSVAELAIVPIQDILLLGSEARMNTPSTTEGNWTWRMRDKGLDLGHLEKLLALYGRGKGR